MKTLPEDETSQESSRDSDSVPPLFIKTSDDESNGTSSDGADVPTGSVVTDSPAVKHRVDMGRRIIHVGQSPAIHNKGESLLKFNIQLVS